PRRVPDGAPLDPRDGVRRRRGRGRRSAVDLSLLTDIGRGGGPSDPGGAQAFYCDQVAGASHAAEGERAGRAALDAGRAADALWIGHRFAALGEAHDVDALVAGRGTDVARDAALRVGEDAELAHARVDVHQRRQRTEKAAPDAPREGEV